MDTLLLVFAIAIALIALLLTGIILIQQPKGGGFGSAFGGIGESVFGAHAANHLTKVTISLTIAFFVLVLAMAVLATKGGASKSLSDELALEVEGSAPTEIVVTEEIAVDTPMAK